jgi:peptidyl-prolyl cis-trans isomerase D
MLRIFHNKKIAKLMWMILLVIIAPAFLLWGVNYYQRSAPGVNEEENFGKIFGKTISRQEYVQALKASQLQLRLQFGEAYAEVQKMIDIKAMALQRLVLLREAHRRRIRVSDQEVVDSIERDPSFSRSGTFDKSAYESVIRYALHLPAREYEEQVRQNMIIRKLSDLASGTIAVTDAEIRDAYRKENEKLNLEYVSAIPADFAGSVNITDTDISDYFSRRSADFKQPLSFNLEYVSTDKEHQVTAIDARLEKEPLEKIAADMGLPLKETGFFTQADPVPGIGWSQQLSNLLPAAKPGKVFAPLEMDKKYYILRLKERREPSVPELAAVKEKVKAAVTLELARKQAKEKIDSFLPKLRENAAGPKAETMARLAQTAGLKSGETGMFKFGSYLEAIGSSDQFFTTGSALTDGQFSDVIEMPSGFYIVRLKGKETADEQKFVNAEETVREKLSLQKKQEMFGKYVEELMKRALQ